jgi:hypothetical protein
MVKIVAADANDFADRQIEWAAVQIMMLVDHDLFLRLMMRCFGKSRQFRSSDADDNE